MREHGRGRAKPEGLDCLEPVRVLRECPARANESACKASAHRLSSVRILLEEADGLTARDAGSTVLHHWEMPCHCSR
jgi:hypothetical protein